MIKMDKIQERIKYIEGQGPLSNGNPGPLQAFEIEGNRFVFAVEYNEQEIDPIEDESEAFNLKYDIFVGDTVNDDYLTLSRLTVQDLSNICDALRRFRG